MVTSQLTYNNFASFVGWGIFVEPSCCSVRTSSMETCEEESVLKGTLFSYIRFILAGTFISFSLRSLRRNRRRWKSGVQQGREGLREGCSMQSKAGTEDYCYHGQVDRHTCRDVAGGGGPWGGRGRWRRGEGGSITRKKGREGSIFSCKAWRKGSERETGGGIGGNTVQEKGRKVERSGREDDTRQDFYKRTRKMVYVCASVDGCKCVWRWCNL